MGVSKGDVCVWVSMWCDCVVCISDCVSVCMCGCGCVSVLCVCVCLCVFVFVCAPAKNQVEAIARVAV